jgi:hypothetical protein
MDADERDVFNFLKSWGGQFVSAREISRRASNKQRFQEEPDWARPVLLRMVGRGILESNAAGRFRIKPISREDREKLWAGTDIDKILEENGEKTEGTDDTANDEYYDQL